MPTPSSFPFPHAELTKIEGTPSTATIKQLKKEIYANARCVHCERGGGGNRYLGIVLPNAEYIVRAGTAFVVPVHPGTQAAHAVTATAAQITEANRIYNKAKTEFATYNMVNESLRQLVLTAVNPLYYQALEDDDFGYADVTIPAIITHLTTTYGTVNATDLVNNRNSLADAWNPDEPFKNLWKRIRNIRQVATAGSEPISDEATVELTITSLRKAGVYDHAITTWEDKDSTEQTWDTFQIHFTKQEKLRLKKLTAASAGYHGANHTVLIPPDEPTSPSLHQASAAHTTGGNHHCDDEAVFYCWSHGLVRNAAHTSKSCNNTSTGHVYDATLMNRKGGSDKISCGRSGKQRRRDPNAPE
jgi:hypothetical protein